MLLTRQLQVESQSACALASKEGGECEEGEGKRKGRRESEGGGRGTRWEREGPSERERDALVDQGRDAAVPEQAPGVLGGGDVGLAVQGDLDAAGAGKKERVSESCAHAAAKGEIERRTRRSG